MIMVMNGGQYVYDHPRPAVTVDVVCFRRTCGQWQVGLIRRVRDPFAGSWALPGGFVEADEDLDDAARRELKEETALAPDVLKQFHCFGEPGRDPRGRTISVAYVALVDRPGRGRAGDDASEFAWFDLDKLPSLAFDHDQIIDQARRSPAAIGVYE